MVQFLRVPSSGVRPVRSLTLLVVVLAAGVVLTGCGSSNPAPSPSPSVAFSTTDLVVGTGAEASNGKTLTVNYIGWLYDESRTDHKGSQFDTSIGKTPYSFVLGASQVIAGWDQGLVGMKVGGQRRLVIPPSLAYGSSGNGPIPPNTALVFDVQLLDVR